MGNKTLTTGVMRSGYVLLVTALLTSPLLSKAQEANLGQTEATSVAADRAPAQTRVQLQEDQITGDDELPKVLYIVPWRSLHETPSLDASPDLGTNELFEPLDPDDHGRLIDYRRALAESEE